tara:strand:- start:415 stop:561 length:147 start_codon:yes stop_codon:yes gene_type:complete
LKSDLKKAGVQIDELETRITLLMESDKINQELKKKIMDRDDVILALRA